MPDQNIILLYGNDDFAIQRRLAAFASTFDDASSADLNIARLEARTVSDDALNNAVNAMPFLAKERLVILSNPSARYTTPETRRKFCEFLEKVPPSTRLVIVEDMPLKSYQNRTRQEKQKKEEEKHWLVKWIKKAGLGLERMALPAQWEMTGWIAQQAKEQGGQMEPAAASRLAEMVGPDTREASQEIAKLLTYVNWSRPVRIEDVQAVSIVTAEADLFKMVDALVTGDGRSASRLLHRLLDDQDAFALWPMVIRQFRLMLLARELLDSHGTPRHLAEAQHVPDFAAEKAFEQARRFSQPALDRIYHKLLDIDEAAKTGRMPLAVGMEMLVTELAG